LGSNKPMELHVRSFILFYW